MRPHGEIKRFFQPWIPYFISIYCQSQQRISFVCLFVFFFLYTYREKSIILISPRIHNLAFLWKIWAIKVLKDYFLRIRTHQDSQDLKDAQFFFTDSTIIISLRLDEHIQPSLYQYRVQSLSLRTSIHE